MMIFTVRRCSPPRQYFKFNSTACFRVGLIAPLSQTARPGFSVQLIRSFSIRNAAKTDRGKSGREDIFDEVHVRLQDLSLKDLKCELLSLGWNAPNDPGGTAEMVINAFQDPGLSNERVKASVPIIQPAVPLYDVHQFIDTTIQSWVADMPIRLIDLEHHRLILRSELVTSLQERLRTKRRIGGEEFSFADQLKKEDQIKWKDELIKELMPYLSYAVFSHRWGEGEPDLQSAMKNLSNWLPMCLSDTSMDTLQASPGLQKLAMFCKTAHSLGYRLAWTDTCCIDKTSSAEYEESINSTFMWYRKAHLCIVYLAQTGRHTNWVHTCDSPEKQQPLYLLDDVDNHLNVHDCYGGHDWRDEWFSRGWTLQELLAPQAIKFYTLEWEELIQGCSNHKNSIELLELLEHATNIPRQAIHNFSSQEVEFGEKMQWASKRTTTRGEDMAYCLLGLLNLNMPILYGEGCEGAFFRLQLEYMKVSNDITMFQWHGRPLSRNSLMASHPVCFCPQASGKEWEPIVRHARWVVEYAKLAVWALVVHVDVGYPEIVWVFLVFIWPMIWAFQLFGRTSMAAILHWALPPPDRGFSLTNAGIRMNLKLHYTYATLLENTIPEKGEFQQRHMLRIASYNNMEVCVRLGQIAEADRGVLMAAAFGDTLILLKPVGAASRGTDLWTRVHTEQPISGYPSWSSGETRHRVIYIQ